MGHRFQKVLPDLGERFDRIVLDEVPLQPVADAVLLSKKTGGSGGSGGSGSGKAQQGSAA